MMAEVGGLEAEDGGTLWDVLQVRGLLGPHVKGLTDVGDAWTIPG